MGKIHTLLKEVEQQRSLMHSTTYHFPWGYTLIIALLLMINFALAGFILNYNARLNNISAKLQSAEVSKEDVTNGIKLTEAKIQDLSATVGSMEEKSREQSKSISELKEANKTIARRLFVMSSSKSE